MTPLEAISLLNSYNLRDRMHYTPSIPEATHTTPNTEGGVSVIAEDYLSKAGSPYEAWQKSMEDRERGSRDFSDERLKAPDWYKGDLLANTEHYLYDKSHPYLNPDFMPLIYNWVKRFGGLTDDTTSKPTRRQLRAGYGVLD